MSIVNYENDFMEYRWGSMDIREVQKLLPKEYVIFKKILLEEIKE